MTETAQVRALREAVETLAYAVDAAAASSGYIYDDDHKAKERIRDCVLQLREARAALRRAVAARASQDLDNIPEDPALATEPECCS